MCPYTHAHVDHSSSVFVQVLLLWLHVGTLGCATFPSVCVASFAVGVEWELYSNSIISVSLLSSDPSALPRVGPGRCDHVWSS